MAPQEKKEEKVIVVSMEPPITMSEVSAVAMSEGHCQQTVTTATSITPIPSASITPSTVSHRKNYPKRENRKPPAHLAEAFGPALFSTPDIIRRVSTDKIPTTPAPASVTTVSQANPPVIETTSPMPPVTAATGCKIYYSLLLTSSTIYSQLIWRL